MNDDSAIKETRLVLRRIQDHLFQAHAAFGAEHETVGLVDVIHHPTSRLPDLNYVTPRRNTAWVSGKFVQGGLDQLQSLDRVPRVQYIEGLYPPLFARTLRDLGLEAETEMPLLAYSPGTIHHPPPLPKPEIPPGVRLELVHDQRGTDLWWYVWRNAYYDVLTLGVEPLAVGRDAAAQQLGQEVDVIMHRHNFPIGVVRVGVQSGTTKSAHIIALALLKEAHTPPLTKLLLAAAMRAALARGCTLIFAPGVREDSPVFIHDLGFIEVGSMVCYAARSANVNEVVEHDTLVQPVLALRR